MIPAPQALTLACAMYAADPRSGCRAGNRLALARACLEDDPHTLWALAPLVLAYLHATRPRLARHVEAVVRAAVHEEVA